MSTLEVLLFVLFVASDSLSAQEALEPNCTGVEDFMACRGNTDNFCPTDISRQCKNEKPFCRCDYFRVNWKEYWYMGLKCNQLWNTLDLVLVTVLPAVGLVIVVVTIFVFVYYSNSEKAGRPYWEVQHNPAFTAETTGDLERDYQQSPRDIWAVQTLKVILRRQVFDDVSATRKLDNDSPIRPEPLTRPDPATDHFSDQQPQDEKFGQPSSDFSYEGCAEGSRCLKNFSTDASCL